VGNKSNNGQQVKQAAAAGTVKNDSNKKEISNQAKGQGKYADALLGKPDKK